MEWDQNIVQMKVGYNKLSNFVSNSENKDLLLKTIENCVCSEEWPEKYYALRDEYMPALLGTDASLFLFWAIMNPINDVIEEINVKPKDVTFLKYLFYNYSKHFFKAKYSNVNPLGFFELRYSALSEHHEYNLHIYRNDNKKFLLRLNIDDSYKMIKQMLYYLVEMNKNIGIRLEDEDKEMLIESTETMAVAIDELSSFLKEGDEDGNE